MLGTVASKVVFSGRQFVLVALAAMVAGCSGGGATYYRSDVVGIGTYVLPEGTLRHNDMRNTDKGFVRIVALLPDPLPRGAGRTRTCFGGFAFELIMKDGTTLDYSSCHQPAWVSTVVQAMQTLPNACYEPHDAQPYLPSDGRTC